MVSYFYSTMFYTAIPDGDLCAFVDQYPIKEFGEYICVW